MNVWLRRITISLGILLLICTLLPLSAYLLLQLPGPRSFAVEQILKRVNHSIDGQIEVDRLQGSLLGSATIKGVRIFDGRQHLAAQIDQASLHFRLLPLLRRQLIVDLVDSSTATALVRTYEDGTLNWTTLTTPSEEESEPPQIAIFVDELRLNDATIIYLDESTALDEAPPRKIWRQTLSQALNKAQNAEDLRRQLPTLFEQETMAPFAAPGAPISAWAHDLQLQASAQIYGHNIGATVSSLDAKARTEILSEPLSLSINDVSFAMSQTTLEAQIDAITLDPLLQARGLSASLILPPSTVTSESPPFELAMANFGRWTLSDPLFSWLIPDLEIPSPITIEGQASADPDRGDLIAQINGSSTSNPISLTAHIEDYLADDLEENLRYSFTIKADNFENKALLHDPAPLAISTNISALLNGEGLNLETLTAHLRARLADSTIDHTYDADLLLLELSAHEGRLQSEYIAALTPYLDLFANLNLDLAGQAQLRARTVADAAQTKAAHQLAGTDRISPPTKADLSLEALANFAPDLIDSPMEALRSLRTSLDWSFAGFRAEEIRIGQSKGALSAELTRRFTETDGDEYHGSYRLNASGRRIRSPFANITAFGLQDKGSLTASLPLDDPLQALKRFENKARLQATGLQTPDLELHSLDLAADLKKRANRSDRADAQIALHLKEASANGFTLEEAQADFSTWITFTDAQEPLAMIRSFYWNGELSAQDLRSESLSLQMAHLSGELQGPLDNPIGQTLLELQDLEVATESLSTVVANLELPGDRQAALTIDGRRTQGGSYDLYTALTFTPGFQKITLSTFNFGSDHTRWKSNPEGLLSWADRELLADAFSLHNQDQSIAIDGNFAPGAHQNLHFTIHSFDLAELRRGFYLEELLPKVKGDLTISGELQGTARSPVATTAIDLQDFYFEDTGPIDLELTAAYQDERLALRELTLQAFDEPILQMSAAIPLIANLQGQAQILWEEHFDLHLDTSQIRLRDFHHPIPTLNDYGVDGLFEATLDASGRVDDPRISLDLDLQDFRFQGMLGATDDDPDNLPPGSTPHPSTTGGEYITLRDLNLEAALSYHSQRTGGDGLYAKTELFWEEELAMEALIETPLPLEEWAQATLDPDHDVPFWRDEFLNLPFRLRLHLPTLELSRIPVESLQAQNIAGQAKIDVDLQGTLGDPHGEVDVAMTNVGWDRFRDLDFHLIGSIQDHLASFERIHLGWAGDEIFVADGAVPIPIAALLAGEVVDDLPIDLRLQLLELPISRLSPIDYGFARIRGSMAAFLEVHGSLRSPRFRSRAGLFNTMLGDGSAGSIYMEIIGADDEITVHGAACHRVDPFLSIDGRAPVQLDLVALAMGQDWRLPGELALRVEGEEIELASDLPVQLLSDFIVDPAGTLAINLEASGSWEEPTLAGFFEMKDGALTLPEFSRRFTNIEGRIDLDEKAISIPVFAVADGPSKAFLSGRIEHETFIPQKVNLKLDADEFNIGGLGVDFPVFLSAKVTVDGEPIGEPGRLKVHISGLEVVLTDEWDQSLHPTDLDDDIIVLGRDRGGAREAAQVVKADSPLDDLHLIVDIAIDRDAWARHPNGDVNLSADITAELTGKIVAITGNVDALRGQLEFLGRQFVIRESQITFIGAVPPDPRLQLEADHLMDRAVTQSLGPPSSGEPRIIFRITGTASAPRLELRSDPMMTDTEILSVLMTGRPPDRSDVGQDEGIAGQALAAVGGLFFGLLQEELAGTVPVDVLRLEPVGAGAEGGRLEVGKYITSDLFLSYRRQFGADEDIASNIIRLEYHFLPRWMVELLYTDRNEGGLNIYWDVY